MFIFGMNGKQGRTVFCFFFSLAFCSERAGAGRSVWTDDFRRNYNQRVIEMITIYNPCLRCETGHLLVCHMCHVVGVNNNNNNWLNWLHNWVKSIYRTVYFELQVICDFFSMILLSERKINTTLFFEVLMNHAFNFIFIVKWSFICPFDTNILPGTTRPRCF